MKKLILLLILSPLFAFAQTNTFNVLDKDTPTVTGGAISGVTSPLGIRSSGAAFDFQIGSSEVLTASRLLSFSLGDAARTLTIAGSTTVPIASQAITIAGPTVARTYTFPDAAATIARTDAANTFTGNQTVTGTLNATTGLQINSVAVNTVLTGTTASIGGALTVGVCDTGTAAVTNSTTSMTVSVSPNTYPGDGYVWYGYVSTNGTVTVKLCGLIVGTPSAGTYNVRVIQ